MQRLELIHTTEEEFGEYLYEHLNMGAGRLVIEVDKNKSFYLLNEELFRELTKDISVTVVKESVHQLDDEDFKVCTTRATTISFSDLAKKLTES